MPMRIALLAVLVATDLGLTAEDIARNFDADADLIEDYLQELLDDGYVKCENGLYFARPVADQVVTIEAVRKAGAD